MQSDIKKDIRFVRKLGQEMIDAFPEFRQNVYYNQEVNSYEQKLINWQLKSTVAFMVIYKLKMLSKWIRSRRVR